MTSRKAVMVVKRKINQILHRKNYPKLFHLNFKRSDTKTLGKPIPIEKFIQSKKKHFLPYKNLLQTISNVCAPTFTCFSSSRRKF